MEEEGYQPKSGFLQMMPDDIPLTGSAIAEANLARLIALTADEDESNRDWATMYLVHSGIDTPEALAALRRAADDDHLDTRCEALLGLAALEPMFAMPRVRALLQSDYVPSLAVEAAGLIGDRALVPVLEQLADAFAEDEDVFFRRNIDDALAACRAGVPVAPWWPVTE